MKQYAIKIALFATLMFFLLSWMTTKVNTYYVPTTVDNFFMPGSQPNESGTFIDPGNCGCHSDYDQTQNIEPVETWKGSMMAQSMRDPLFAAALTIANQDAQFSGDLCIRCHSPVGWLEGRSTPTDGSALTTADREGVQCHFCHKLIDPQSTATEDQTYLSSIAGHVPTVHGNGMYVVDSDDIRRGQYNDANAAPHNWAFSDFHTKSELCATCHDVSNPAFSKAMDGTYQPNAPGTSASSFDTYDMFPVERTYSEWKMSVYNTPGNVISCMDCHMVNATGKACSKGNAPIRNNVALHDLTGGNTFVPLLVKDQYPTEVDATAIDAGIIRAQNMLQNAATMNLEVSMAQNGYDLNVEIINETGHKLPSGYPEGRRIWINVQAYDSGDNLIYESGAYDSSTGTLNTTDAKIYEIKLGMSQEIVDIANAYGTGTYTTGESFHFALNNMVVKDNRIPPRGFTNANFEAIQAAPVGYTYVDDAYSDVTTYNLPEATYEIKVKLLYQTTSKEYIEFLRDNNVTNTLGQNLYNLWVAYGRSEPEVMQEAEFYTSSLGLVEKDIVDDVIKIYPNPAANKAKIMLGVQNPKDMVVELFSLNGIKIRTLFHEVAQPNNEVLEFETSDLASGIYVIRINMNGSLTSRLLIIK